MAAADLWEAVRAERAKRHATRQSETWASRMGDFMVAALISAVITGAAVAMGRDARRVHGVRRRGIRTTGIVVGIRETTDGDGCAQLYPRVRYTLPDGREVTGEGGAHSVRTPLPEGDRAELLYRPEDPERIILIACSAIASLLRSACIT
ncbi:DUF3592 domain-containing protein [Streptomyces sp. 900105755]